MRIGVRGERRQATLISRFEYSYAPSFTIGVSVKFSGIGGDSVFHSRPVARHGFAPAASPLKSE